MSSPRTPMYDRHVQFELTPVESTLRRLLVDVAEYIDSSSTQHSAGSELQLPDALARSKVELRFTGGWVRDKLLGMGSQDIDVAINKMTGYQFGLKMREYLEIPGNKQKYGLEDSDHAKGVPTKGDSSGEQKVISKADLGRKTHKGLGGLHKIEANPEKSKHLETVTTKVLGLDIDLVNLRKETYSEDSRHPQMEFGTPEEDALRRDASVNALFYNLHTSSIEDFTGCGFDDMERKTIRTPLEPYQTFKDDPLRVLRLIRFASRLGFQIDYETEKSMANESIKAALRTKISRERVGAEIEKILKGQDPEYAIIFAKLKRANLGKDPFGALVLIDRLGLYNTIFTDPENNLTSVADLSYWQQTYQFLYSVLYRVDQGSNSATDSCSKIRSMLIRSAEEAYLAWLLAALTPWASVQALPTTKPGKKKLQPMAAVVAREGLKVNNKVYEVITGACRNAEEITKIITELKSSSENEDPGPERNSSIHRSALGMAIRRWGSNWRYHVLFALLLDLKYIGNNSQEIDNVLGNYAAFLSRLEKFDISQAYLLKPLLDGNHLCKELHVKPGPWMKDALEMVIEWQLKHPGQADPQAVVEEVEKRRIELGIK